MLRSAVASLWPAVAGLAVGKTSPLRGASLAAVVRGRSESEVEAAAAVQREAEALLLAKEHAKIEVLKSQVGSEAGRGGSSNSPARLWSFAVAVRCAVLT